MLSKHFLFVFIISFLLSPLASAADYYVTPTGNGSRDGSSWVNADRGWAGINAGLTSVGANGTVYLGGGSWPRNGYGSNIGTTATGQTITTSDDGIYGGDSTFDFERSGTTFNMVHNNGTITGTASSTLKMTGYGTTEFRSFITVDNADNIEIAYVELYEASYNKSSTGTGSHGIRLRRTDGGSIHNSTFYNLGRGQCDSGVWGPISLGYDDGSNTYGQVTNWEIYSNTLYDSYNGINFNAGTGNNGNLIHDNHIYGMANGGIVVDGATNSNNNEVYDNDIHDCSVGNINAWHASSTVGTGWKFYRNLLYFTEGRRFMDAVFIAHLDSSEFYNNVLYDGGFSGTNECSDATDFRAFDIRDTADSNEFYNNTVYSTGSGSTRAFWVWGATGSTFRNNAVYLTSNNSQGGYAVYYEGADTDTWENNAWYNPNKSYFFRVNGSDRNFSYWQGFGFDSPIGFDENPDFKNVSNLPTYSARTREGLVPNDGTGSPLINNGTDTSGTLADDFFGNLRSGSYDIGAYENAGENPPPDPPTGLTVLTVLSSN